MHEPINVKSVMHVLNVRTPLERIFSLKSNTYFKIVRLVTESKVHKKDQKILSSTVQNLITTAKRTPEI